MVVNLNDAHTKNRIQERANDFSTRESKTEFKIQKSERNSLGRWNSSLSPGVGVEHFRSNTNCIAFGRKLGIR